MRIPILRVKDENGNVVEILAIKGDSYVLTAADKQEIAEMVIDMLQNGDEVSY
jgi:hypothetical protein